jgi:hypothetical protein
MRFFDPTGSTDIDVIAIEILRMVRKAGNDVVVSICEGTLVEAYPTDTITEFRKRWETRRKIVRNGEIAFALIKRQLLKNFRMGDYKELRRKLGPVAQETNIPLEELMGFAMSILEDFFGNSLNKGSDLYKLLEGMAGSGKNGIFPRSCLGE